MLREDVKMNWTFLRALIIGQKHQIPIILTRSHIQRLPGDQRTRFWLLFLQSSKIQNGKYNYVLTKGLICILRHVFSWWWALVKENMENDSKTYVIYILISLYFDTETDLGSHQIYDEVIKNCRIHAIDQCCVCRTTDTFILNISVAPFY